MSWNLKGSYVETCSCELMCPCNLSFDHGATYDFCRVVLVFDIREGQVDGTDIGGLRVAALCAGGCQVSMSQASPPLPPPAVRWDLSRGHGTRDVAWPDAIDWQDELSRSCCAWLCSRCCRDRWSSLVRRSSSSRATERRWPDRACR